MTDIVEQAARVLSTQTTCDGEPHPTELHRRQAQALADAGLLRDEVKVRGGVCLECGDGVLNNGEHIDPSRHRDHVKARDSRTVPTRDEIVEAVSDIDAESWPNPASTEEIADAILALMAEQPTVAEVKAQALEEFAEVWATGEWSDWFLAENVTCDVSAVQATDKALRERAQEIREYQ